MSAQFLLNLCEDGFPPTSSEKTVPLCYHTHRTPTARRFLDHSAAFENIHIIAVLKFLPPGSLNFFLLSLVFSGFDTCPLSSAEPCNIRVSQVPSWHSAPLLTLTPRSFSQFLASLNSQMQGSQFFSQFSYLVVPHVSYIQYV